MFYIYSLEYKTPDVARIVLNKLEVKGYQVVGSTGIGQTCVWTLHKPESTVIEIVNASSTNEP